MGTSPLTAFGVALNLPLDATKVTFPPSGLQANPAVLDPGQPPSMAAAALPGAGPLQGVLTLGVARKKQIGSDGDVVLPAGARLFSLTLDLAPNAPTGMVFDGVSPGKKFAAGVINLAGQRVVDKTGFAIGQLSVTY